MNTKERRSRATHVAGDSRQRRLLTFLFKVVRFLLLPTLYLFYSLSGLYLCGCGNIKIERTDHLRLLHRLKVCNDKKLQYGSRGRFVVDDPQF